MDAPQQPSFTQSRVETGGGVSLYSHASVVICQRDEWTLSSARGDKQCVCVCVWEGISSLNWSLLSTPWVLKAHQQLVPPAANQGPVSSASAGGFQVRTEKYTFNQFQGIKDQRKRERVGFLNLLVLDLSLSESNITDAGLGLCVCVCV